MVTYYCTTCKEHLNEYEVILHLNFFHNVYRESKRGRLCPKCRQIMDQWKCADYCHEWVYFCHSCNIMHKCSCWIDEEQARADRL